METSQVELERLNKKKLIEIIHKQEEQLLISEECENILRLDLKRS